VHIGASGAGSDGGAFGETGLKEAFKEDCSDLHVAHPDNFFGFTCLLWQLPTLFLSRSTGNKKLNVNFFLDKAGRPRIQPRTSAGFYTELEE